jgi:hypothetical protein
MCVCISICLSAFLYVFVCSSEFNLTPLELHLCIQMSSNSDFSQKKRFCKRDKNQLLCKRKLDFYILVGVFRCSRNTSTKYLSFSCQNSARPSQNLQPTYLSHMVTAAVQEAVYCHLHSPKCRNKLMCVHMTLGS